MGNGDGIRDRNQKSGSREVSERLYCDCLILSFARDDRAGYVILHGWFSGNSQFAALCLENLFLSVDGPAAS